MSEDGMTPQAISRLRQFCGSMLLLTGMASIAVVLISALMCWGEPRISTVFEYSGHGFDDNEYLNRGTADPSTASVVMLVAALILALGFVMRGSQVSLRRLLISVLVVGCLSAILRTGVCYAPSRGECRIQFSMQPTTSEIDEFQSIVRKKLAAALPQAQDVVAVNAYFDAATSRLVTITELTPALDDMTTRRVLKLAEQEWTFFWGFKHPK